MYNIPKRSYTSVLFSLHKHTIIIIIT